MPNGELSEEYEPDVLRAGKNPGKKRFSYSTCRYFKLLEGNPLRTKILVWDPQPDIERHLRAIKEIYKNKNQVFATCSHFNSFFYFFTFILFFLFSLIFLK